MRKLQILMVGSVGLVACDEIVVPKGDETAPVAQVSASVEGLGGGYVVVVDDQSGPAFVAVEPSDPIDLLAVVTDEDGGVRWADLVGEASASCVGPNGSFQVHLQYAAAQPYFDPGGVSDTAYTQGAAWITDVVPASACLGGGTLVAWRLDVFGLGANFHGGTDETPFLTLSYEQEETGGNDPSKFEK
jgi:hypothetical protein